MPTLRQQLIELIDKLSPDMEKAFLDAIADIKSEIVLREVVERLERRDIAGAIEALHIDQAAFRPLSEAIRQAFNSGGILTTGRMPRLTDPMGGRVVFRWDVENQAAQAIIRDLSSMLITNVTEDTKEMARERIEAGYAKGQGPQAIAVDLAGRVNRITRVREGGLIGLTSGLARTVEKARGALAAGDIEGMKAYLRLEKRDRRFDRTVVKAILTDEQAVLDAEMFDQMTEEFSKTVDQSWENFKAAIPVATVINDNQPGKTAIIEILTDPPTLAVGTKLFAAPVRVTEAA